MLRVSSALFQNNVLRWLAWLGVVLTLIATFLSYSNHLQEQVMRTKVVIVADTMQQRINQLHQLWLVNKQPNRLEIDGRMVEFDSAGWVGLSNHDLMGCNHLLTALYPSNNQEKFKLITKHQELATSSYVCVYTINGIADIKVRKVKSLRIEIVM